MNERGYDTEGMRIFSDETLETEVPLSEIPKEAIEQILGGVLITRCKNCSFFRENWKCVTWHMFVRPDGYCFRAERKPDANESV